MNSSNLRVQHQRGLVLIVTLVVLTVMVLTSLAMMRTLDTSQGAMKNYTSRMAGDAYVAVPIEYSIKWLKDQFKANKVLLNATNGGYWANYPGNDNENGIPYALIAVESSKVFNSKTLGLPASDYKAYVTIERLCRSAGEPMTASNPCVGSEQAGGSTTRNKAMDLTLKYGGVASANTVTYRITARVETTDASVSYGQAFVQL